ncbi:16S rRNA (adenine(1518)-N(6)/adenine(1519)-N(6))-dimethyltransferase RsmA [Leptolyngbya boryana CZ1]|uniref:Ribosomal RNA small subunit methyltransferase A n=2 Tax=Leptolyngbya boryana TaxID=1184 RepID=A0A1Z4JDK4_LEPBY|nr:16S rRNA (adenine(1518)-N(6)/adenine(1519)-N(6))-dimethyltransferase RsmA [Leptolyngbya boryana]MBD2365821.1 16S rRNA (adenine(1518)-N(6)/adenine(1519)-N(6))-dimethyltransferase RsmA [Leptolyngbya sp. FACHB-161]MBD2372001.1 16S rRNA (adenine(1518)-N(6)/adenine(1519)-N(6))-dimethyltransferase RsmA [Leptolyngbya sp. FACHB-238]MBD2396425.1 16S rRNA (adenine(1518)-N(6)/adenine(1519)-N(6))-dimethyltransferase RsmA [Leptolyngbya sp. FACHB-239]MBD2402947.1 16S rRNA (adenine(1518)-N(6)/adenine(1519)
MPKARKQFGQHWLKSEKALAKIVSAAELNESDRVLEIGPGTGILTRQLLSQAQAVVAVEIDRDLCPILVQKFGQFENFVLLQGDFLTLDIDELLEPFPAFQQPRKVVANIPYNITGPILEKLLGTIAAPNPQPFESIVLLLQKEVALRICGNPNSSHYGALSIRVQYLADAEFICDVPAKAFSPPPKVDSAVIRLKPRAIELPANDPRKLETLVKLGFASRRKMLRNNLKSLIEVEELNQLLERLNLNPQARAEDLSVEEWVTLSNAFVS